MAMNKVERSSVSDSALEISRMRVDAMTLHRINQNLPHIMIVASNRSASQNDYADAVDTFTWTALEGLRQWVELARAAERPATIEASNCEPECDVAAEVGEIEALYSQAEKIVVSNRPARSSDPIVWIAHRLEGVSEALYRSLMRRADDAIRSLNYLAVGADYDD